MLFSTNVLGICLYPNAQFCSCSWARTKWNGKTFQGLNHVLLADQEGRVLQKQSYNDFEITPVKTRKYQRRYFFFVDSFLVHIRSRLPGASIYYTYPRENEVVSWLTIWENPFPYLSIFRNISWVLLQACCFDWVPHFGDFKNDLVANRPISIY